MTQENRLSSETEKSQQIHKSIIIGSGPAGYAASLYLARAEFSPIQFSGMQLGGQAALTHSIDNYPGFPDGIGGVELGGIIPETC